MDLIDSNLLFVVGSFVHRYLTHVKYMINMIYLMMELLYANYCLSLCSYLISFIEKSSQMTAKFYLNFDFIFLLLNYFNCFRNYFYSKFFYFPLNLIIISFTFEDTIRYLIRFSFYFKNNRYIYNIIWIFTSYKQAELIKIITIFMYETSVI